MVVLKRVKIPQQKSNLIPKTEIDMDNIKITKGGLTQMVSRAAYEKQYKPNGWVVDATPTKLDKVQETVKSLKSEVEVINYLGTKKHEPKQFNDGLFKSDKQ